MDGRKKFEKRMEVGLVLGIAYVAVSIGAIIWFGIL